MNHTAINHAAHLVERVNAADRAKDPDLRKTHHMELIRTLDRFTVVEVNEVVKLTGGEAFDIATEDAALFTLTYYHCGNSWSDTGPHMTNDECPTCRAEVEPDQVKDD